MGQSFGKHKPSQLTQSEVNNLNNATITKEIKFIKREGNTSNSSYENSITLTPKPEKVSKKEKKKTIEINIPNEDSCKNP